MTYPKQLQIVNDNGIGFDTKIIDVQTGQDITVGLRCAKIVITAGDPISATLTVEPTLLHLRVTAEYTATLTYDPNDADTIEKAIGHLQARLTELRAS